MTTEWYSACDGASACVKVRRYAGFVELCAGVDPHAITPMTEEEWQDFITAVKAGKFDAYVHVRAHDSQCA